MTDARDTPEKTDPRIVCFERRADDETFESSVVRLMGSMQEQSRKIFVSEHNVLRMNHGGRWVHAAREPEVDTSMHTISAEWLIPFKDIAENELSLIDRTILPINEEMEKQFAQNMYSVVGAAAESVGNIVDARAVGSFSQSLLTVLKKIELGVDRDGNVSMPQIHVAPETAERIANEMQNLPQEIEIELEKIKAEKVAAAYAKESDRKSKFKKIGV